MNIEIHTRSILCVENVLLERLNFRCSPIDHQQTAFLSFACRRADKMSSESRLWEAALKIKCCYLAKQAKLYFGHVVITTTNDHYKTAFYEKRCSIRIEIIFSLLPVSLAIKPRISKVAFHGIVSRANRNCVPSRRMRKEVPHYFTMMGWSRPQHPSKVLVSNSTPAEALLLRVIRSFKQAVKQVSHKKNSRVLN